MKAQGTVSFTFLPNGAAPQMVVRSCNNSAISSCTTLIFTNKTRDRQSSTSKWLNITFADYLHFFIFHFLVPMLHWLSKPLVRFQQKCSLSLVILNGAHCSANVGTTKIHLHLHPWTYSKTLMKSGNTFWRQEQSLRWWDTAKALASADCCCTLHGRMIPPCNDALLIIGYLIRDWQREFRLAIIWYTKCIKLLQYDGQSGKYWKRQILSVGHYTGYWFISELTIGGPILSSPDAVVCLVQVILWTECAS